MKIFLLILAGAAGGIIGGMGMGGGTLLIPILTLFLNVDQRLAQGINLISFIPMAVVALIIHSKNKLVRWRIFPIVAIPALFTAIPSAYFATVTNTEVLKKCFAGFLIILAIANIIYFIAKEVKEKQAKEKNKPKNL